MTKHVLLTGAAGFVGSHVLRHILTNTDWTVSAPVTFRHKGVPARIASAVADHPDWWERVDVVYCDLSAPIDRITENRFGDVHYILNVASESHVDRSIEAPSSFIRNNVDLMLNVLEYARRVKPQMLLQMSTDEVYGPAYDGHRHTEWEAIAPSNPYSASKAAQEAISFSFWRTYGVNLVLTNTMNIVGETQDPEKFVPMILRNLRDGKPVPVHVAPDGTSGSRFYLHARNLADAWLWILRNHTPAAYSDGAQRPSRFNIVGEREVTNIEMVDIIARYMGIDAYQVEKVNFHQSRPGHDLRYALDGTELAKAGWTAPLGFEDSLRKTVEWTLRNPAWLM
jgi:dTDP-glucose 4,6-dehydratase